MVPNDDLFDPTDTSAAPTPTEGGGGGEGGAPANPPSGPTLADIQAAIQNAMSSGNQETARALQDIQSKVEALERATPKPPAAPTPKPDEKLDTFLQDIDSYIDKRSSDTVIQRLAPVLKLQLAENRDRNITEAQRRFEEEHGDGAWAELLATDVEGHLDKLPLEMQASKSHLEGAVALALGKLMMSPEGRTKLATKRQEQEKRMETPRMFTGGGRVRPTGPEVSDSEKDFVGALQRAGFKYTLKDYVAARGVGNSESAWREHLAKQKGASK